MILVAPPQTPSDTNPLLYVLLASDGAAFVLSLPEAVRVQKTGHVDFIPWREVPEAKQELARKGLSQHHALNARLADAA